VGWVDISEEVPRARPNPGRLSSWEVEVEKFNVLEEIRALV
jgi:hypothetical protein